MSAVTFFTEDSLEIEIPVWVHDLESFRQWVRSDEFPEEGQICWFGNPWIDMSKEQIFSHNQVKLEIARVLANLVKEDQTGMFFADGARLSHATADLSNVPDGMFAKSETIKNEKLKMVESADKAGPIELEGTPDMVLEVISTSSVQKDTDILFDRYWRAGIAEYWMIDARGDRLRFQIYETTSGGFRIVKPVDGWSASKIFECSFRLTESENALGHREFSLDSR